jgi:hypothetical protein
LQIAKINTKNKDREETSEHNLPKNVTDQLMNSAGFWLRQTDIL